MVLHDRGEMYWVEYYLCAIQNVINNMNERFEGTIIKFTDHTKLKQTSKNFKFWGF